MTNQKISEIKVGGVVWDVNVDLRLGASEGAIGMCDFETAEITLDGVQGEQRMQQTLAHELVHAMLFEAGYEEHDEDMVNRLGIVLHQVLADNYEFVGHDGIRDEIAEIRAERNGTAVEPESSAIGYDTEAVRYENDGGDE